MSHGVSQIDAIRALDTRGISPRLGAQIEAVQGCGSAPFTREDDIPSDIGPAAPPVFETLSEADIEAMLAGHRWRPGYGDGAALPRRRSRAATSA